MEVWGQNTHLSFNKCKTKIPAHRGMSRLYAGLSTRQHRLQAAVPHARLAAVLRDPLWRGSTFEESINEGFHVYKIKHPSGATMTLRGLEARDA